MGGWDTNTFGRVEVPRKSALILSRRSELWRVSPSSGRIVRPVATYYNSRIRQSTYADTTMPTF